jgi:hypothetical protein
MKKIYERFSTLMFGTLLAAYAYADVPHNERIKREREFRFGDVLIRQTFNSMRDPMSPVFTLQVYDGKDLVLQLREAAFDSFHQSPDGKAFVGLSNSGWPGTAAIIFDRSGRLLLLAEHNRISLHYCQETSTFTKVWYDDLNPKVEFPVFSGNVRERRGITLRDCQGKTVDLLDTLQDDSPANRFMTLREEIHVRYGIRNKTQGLKK